MKNRPINMNIQNLYLKENSQICKMFKFMKNPSEYTLTDRYRYIGTKTKLGRLILNPNHIYYVISLFKQDDSTIETFEIRDIKGRKSIIQYENIEEFKDDWIKLSELKPTKSNGDKKEYDISVLITGSSSGIGKALAEYVLSIKNLKVKVYGIDIKKSTINNSSYHHYIADVGLNLPLPDIEDVDILINNAGIEKGDVDSILRTNLIGVINCTEKYALNNDKIKSVVNLASVSGHNGAEFPYYCASKGGVLAYTKSVAKALAPRAICNSISFGGVLTELNSRIITNEEKWESVMRETPMKKWCTPEEAARWIWFVAYENKSMTGQDIIIDNGEFYNHNFID